MFYVNKASEIERGTPRLVINYKPFNTLRWIRYPIPNKKDLMQKLHHAFIFSVFYAGDWRVVGGGRWTMVHPKVGLGCMIGF